MSNYTFTHCQHYTFLKGVCVEMSRFIYLFTYLSSPEDIFSLRFFFRERRREKHQCERIDWLPPLCAWTIDHKHLDWGLNLQSRYVSTPGIDPAVLWLWDDAPTI